MPLIHIMLNHYGNTVLKLLNFLYGKVHSSVFEYRDGELWILKVGEVGRQAPWDTLTLKSMEAEKGGCKIYACAKKGSKIDFFPKSKFDIFLPTPWKTGVLNLYFSLCLEKVVSITWILSITLTLRVPHPCRRKTFMVHQTFVWWALFTPYKFVKSPIRHLGLAIENVRRILPTLLP